MRSTLSSSLIPTGWSMAPLIKPGCQLVVDFKNKNYHLGDVVIFSKENRFLAHRIINLNKQKKLFLLKGDNNPSLDGWIRSQKILGRIEKIIYPNYTINLLSRKNQILKYLFVIYSRLNYYVPSFLAIRDLYKISLLKIVYRFLIES